MKVIIDYKEPAESFERVKALIAASALRDIQLSGHDCTVERGEYTSIENEGLRTEDATTVFSAVCDELQDASEPDSRGHRITVFGVMYKPSKIGRPELPPEDRTRPRTIWMTDAEWAKVQAAPKGWVRGLVQRSKVPA